MMHENELLQTMDATVWAAEFMERFKDRKQDIDADLMLGWFANAIMTGWDFRERRGVYVEANDER